ncbi:MAG: hypothetical protein FJZ90_10090 [Chloroflexi bacterium]|nr:hypothetical protein [Chloroflexota bacterium]
MVLLLVLLLRPAGSRGAAAPEANREARPAQAATPSLVVSYTYDAAGRLVQVDYGGGRRVAYTYDQAGNLLRREVLGVSPTPSLRPYLPMVLKGHGP